MRRQRAGSASCRWPSPPIAGDRAEIDRNFAGFNRIVLRADRAARSGDASGAAQLATAAAHFAWARHPGIFHSPRLERLLVDIGGGAGRESNAVRAESRDPRRVLHVMTSASAVGGHTRLARRWIEWDDGRLHAVALTGQASEIPSDLVGAARAAGGEVFDLGLRDPVQRARRLREIVLGFDAIVLHTHPHDVVPLIALAEPGVPPVTFVNHADHVFWLGGAVSNVVASIRPSGERLAVLRRGVAPERSARMPVPMPTPVRSLERGAAKRALGLTADELLALTIAVPYKLGGRGQEGFLELARPVLERFPTLTWVVVGPEEDRAWVDVRRATGGRLHAVGVHPQVNVFYEAADLYVDSYPLGSLTSVLEATSYGVPAVGYCPYEGSARHFCIDDPAFEGPAVRAQERDTFVRELARLVDDPAAREAEGRRAAESLAAAHTGPGWLQRVQETYRQAASTPRATPMAGATEVPTADEIDRWLPRLVPAPVPYAHVELAPARSRLQLRNELRQAGFPIRPIELVRAVTPIGIRRLVRRLRDRRSAR